MSVLLGDLFNAEIFLYLKELQWYTGVEGVWRIPFPRGRPLRGPSRKGWGRRGSVPTSRRFRPLVAGRPAASIITQLQEAAPGFLAQEGSHLGAGPSSGHAPRAPGPAPGTNAPPRVRSDSRALGVFLPVGSSSCPALVAAAPPGRKCPRCPECPESRNGTELHVDQRRRARNAGGESRCCPRPFSLLAAPYPVASGQVSEGPQPTEDTGLGSGSAPRSPLLRPGTNPFAPSRPGPAASWLHCKEARGGAGGGCCLAGPGRLVPDGLHRPASARSTAGTLPMARVTWLCCAAGVGLSGPGPARDLVIPRPEGD